MQQIRTEDGKDGIRLGIFGRLTLRVVRMEIGDGKFLETSAARMGQFGLSGVCGDGD